MFPETLITGLLRVVVNIIVAKFGAGGEGRTSGSTQELRMPLALARNHYTGKVVVNYCYIEVLCPPRPAYV
jgi:hypothetical protein